jgi:hypothetical protein
MDRLVKWHPRIGEPATVSHCWGGYLLPKGLTEGEIVRVLEFDHGTYTVECPDGRRFRISSSCVDTVPPEFYANHRAETFLKRMRALFRCEGHRSELSISTSFRYLNFTVYGEDHRCRGSLEIHKDAILNLGSDFRERIVRQLLALRARPSQ